MTVRLSFVVLALALLPVAAHAMSLKPAERVVPGAYRQIAAQARVPYKILYAIALVESGYRAPSNGQHRPWPWTLNFAGESMRFPNKSATLSALNRGIRDGRTNVDVGIAQINYHWNRKLFPSLEQAVDPMINLRLATHVLKRELAQCRSGDWWCAVGRYHSPGPSQAQQRRAAQYTQRVRKVWSQLK